MGKNNKTNNLSALSSLVFSTNPEAMIPEKETFLETLANDQQILRIRIEKKHRGGKTATIIDGFEGREEDLEDLAKKLKTKCGTGGSAKDGIIIIQGDYREKILTWLKDWGYKNTK